MAGPAWGRRLSDDGKRFNARNVSCIYFVCIKGGSLRGGSGRDRSVIGGWRMTGSAFRCWTLRTDCFSERRTGEGSGEGNRVAIGALPEGWRMTGSALRRWTLCMTLLLAEKKGKGVRGKGALPASSLMGGWRIYVGALGVFSGFVKVAEGRFLR